MKKDGKPPTYDTFQSLITGLLDAYKPRDAAMLFEQMLTSDLVKPSELPSRVVSYVTIVNELLSAEDFEGVHTFVLMLNENGFNVDYITCANILKALSRKGQVQALDDVFDEMRSKGLLPDVVKLKELVNNHCKGLVSPDSLKLLSALISTIDSIAYFKTSEDGKSVEATPSAEITELEAPSLSSTELDTGPDFVLFDQIIRSLCVYEKSEDAYQLMLKMDEYGESLSATTSMLLFDAICWASKWEEAELTLRKMMQVGHLPDLKVYNSWVQGSCKADRLENITNFLDEFGHGDLILDALSYNVAVEKLCMAGKLDEAKKLTTETKRNLGTPDVVIYSRMIQSFAKAGDFEVPRKLLDEMIELGITPFALPFTPLVQKLCISGKMDEAVVLVDEIEAKGCKPLSSLYTIIVSAYCKAQRLQDAFNLTDIMKAKGVTPETQIHKELFGSCMGTRTLRPVVKVQ
jgi:pentatricopeptide repeat protein